MRGRQQQTATALGYGKRRSRRRIASSFAPTPSAAGWTPRSDLHRLMLAYFLFNTTEWSTWVAILVYAFEHGGATASAVAAAVQLVPAALLAPLGAVLGDRLPRLRVLTIGFLLQSVTLAATALLLTIEAPLPLVYTAAAAAAASIALTRPVFFAALPAFTGTQGCLATANSAAALLEGIAVFIGPIIAGLMLELYSAAAVFAVFALAQLLAAGQTATCQMTAMAHGMSASLERARSGLTLMKEAIAGFVALSREPGVAILVACIAAAFMLVGITDVLVVVFALDVIEAGPSGSGLLIAAMGVGGLFGAAACMPLLRKVRLAPVAAVGGLVAGASFSMTGLSGGLAGAFLLLAVSGAGKSLLDVAARTLLQRHVPDAIRARVFGVQESLMQASLAVGSLLVPLLLAGFGARGAFVAAGLALPIVAALSWRRIASIDTAGHA